MTAYLPSHSDWKTWFKWSSELKIESFNSEGYKNIPKEDFRIIFLLARQLRSLRPPTRDELVEEIEYDYTYAFSDGNALQEMSQSTRLRYLKELQSSKYFQICSMTDWTKKHGSLGTEEKKLRKLHGRNEVYPLTGRGSIAYELGLQLPCFSYSLLGYSNNLGVSDFILHLGVLARENRMRWNRAFLDRNRLPVTKYQNSIFDEQEETLGNNKELFWTMTGPATLLIREYANLLEIERWAKSKGRHADLKRDDPEDGVEWRKYYRGVESNLITSHQILGEIAGTTIRETIEPRLRQIGISAQKARQNISTALEDQDPLLRFNRG